MNNSIFRAILILFHCFILSGCTVGTRTTTLPDIPSKPEETQLLKSVGFLVHDEIVGTHGLAYAEIEKKAWINALLEFTDRKNIFMVSDRKAANLITPPAPPAKNSKASDKKPAAPADPLAVFARGNPIIEISIRPSNQGDLTMNDVTNEAPFMLTFLTFGLIPTHIPIPYKASFTLTFPEDTHVPPEHWEYSYERDEFYWLPVIIPLEDYLASIDEDIDVNLWRTEEKSRLVLKFLQDAKIALQEVVLRK